MEGGEGKGGVVELKYSRSALVDNRVTPVKSAVLLNWAVPGNLNRRPTTGVLAMGEQTQS